MVYNMQCSENPSTSYLNWSVNCSTHNVHVQVCNAQKLIYMYCIFVMNMWQYDFAGTYAKGIRKHLTHE